MKKIGLILLSLFVSLQVSAEPTTTTTTFQDVAYKGVTSKENQFGEMQYYKEATINTQNFRVNNFWDKFSGSDKGQSAYSQVSKTGVFQLTVEATSLCTLYPELDA